MTGLRLTQATLTLTALALVLSAESPVLAQSEGDRSLYERLGGYEAISAVATDFAQKLFTDSEVGSFFKGMGTDTRQSFIQKNINLVCAVTGGPCKIISRPARTVHAGLGITDVEFDIVVGHLVDTLDDFRVPSREKAELLSIIDTLRPDIVEG